MIRGKFVQCIDLCVGVEVFGYHNVYYVWLDVGIVVIYGGFRGRVDFCGGV